MFFAWLVAAGFQLLCAAGVFAIARTRTVAGVIAATLAGVFGVLLSAASPLLFLQGLVLALIGIICTCAKTRQRVFVGCAATASVTILGLAGGLGVRSWVGLKERYPFESMSARLAYEANHSRPALLSSPTLTDSTRDRLKKAEERHSWNSRGRALKLVHASFVEQFVESPGFGIGRMLRPSPYNIEWGDKRAQARFALDVRPDRDGSPDVGTGDVIVESQTAQPSIFVRSLDALHDEARRDFLDLSGFGYVRDRDHVAGFVPHGFLNGRLSLFTGERHAQWQTVRVDLVSLLKHQRPMAYVSRHLPNMTELRDAPVRELDEFEQRALSSLIAGEDLVSDGHLDRVRALGSLRATTQCLRCHEVERGTLLGAFSYEFLRDPPTVPVHKSAPQGDEQLL